MIRNEMFAYLESSPPCVCAASLTTKHYFKDCPTSSKDYVSKLPRLPWVRCVNCCNCGYCPPSRICPKHRITINFWIHTDNIRHRHNVYDIHKFLHYGFDCNYCC